MSLFDFFKKKKDLEFVDTSRMAYHNFPVMRAVDVKPKTLDIQKKKYNKHAFAHCPGMIQYSQLGYIIPAWVDIHIKANKAGVVQFVGSSVRGDRGFSNARIMDHTAVDGVFEIEDDVPPTALNFPCPWSVHTRGDVTALLMPAFYHSDFLDDLYVFPGSVDYNTFKTISFICMPKRECEIHIKAGTPLLHVIPFWNKPFNAGYGPGEDHQLDAAKNDIPGDDKQYYRKFHMTKKEFNLDE